MVEKYQKFAFPASSQKDVGFEHLENAKSEDRPKVSKRAKVKRHLKRFWCCYLIAGVIFLAIFLPLL
jgi:hypothetical protein